MAADSTKNTLYISQRAANAIIADVAPYRISSEALPAINTFLDEFLYLLIDAAHSLDLVRIKNAINTVLPTSVGKRAVSEAELELKTYVESAKSDNAKERTIEISPFPLQKVFEQFRLKCQFFSTLGERGADDREPDSVPDLYASEGIHIAPSLAIYLTAVLEYIGEHILISVAKTSEKHRVEEAKFREVYMALSEDTQISPLFRRMDLKEQMEEQIGFRVQSSQDYNSRKVTYAAPTSPRNVGRTSLESAKSPRSGTYSPVSSKHSPNGSTGRKLSMDGLGSTNGHSSLKRTSEDIKSPRSTRSMQSLGSSGERENDMKFVSSQEESTEKIKNFDQLLTSGQTMKVSLTPNRLVTIEANNRPPKLAPRAPVSRTISLTTSSKNTRIGNHIDDSDDDEFFQKGPKKESLYEFLKNTSPEDVLGGKNNTVKNRPSRDAKRGKSIDQLESINKKPATNPRYVPLIPPSKSTPTSPAMAYQPSAYSSRSIPTSDSGAAKLNGFNSTNNLSPYTSKHGSKSTGHLQTKSRPRPDPLSLDDDDLFLADGQKRPNRKHQNQELMDFLATTPPSEKTSFPESARINTIDFSEKKKPKKFAKFLGRFRKPSVSDEPLTSNNRTYTMNSNVNSAGTVNTLSSIQSTNKPRYVKIEIPQLPAEEKAEPSIFDQVEVQGRHARHLSKTNSLNSLTRSPQGTPNRATFNGNDRRPVSPGICEEDEGEERPSAAARSSNLSMLAQAGSGRNTPVQVIYNSSSSPLPHNSSAYSPQPNASNITLKQKMLEETHQPQQNYALPPPPQRQNSGPITSSKMVEEQTRDDQLQREQQEILRQQKQNRRDSSFPAPLSVMNKLKNLPPTPILTNEQPHNSRRSSSPSTSQTTPQSPITITVTPEALEHLRNRVGRSPSIDEAVKVVDEFVEVVTESTIDVDVDVVDADADADADADTDTDMDVDTDEEEELEVLVEVNEQDEREEAIIVEWLLGTGFGFKSSLLYSNIDEYGDSIGELSNEEEDEQFVEAVDDAMIMTVETRSMVEIVA